LREAAAEDSAYRSKPGIGVNIGSTRGQDHRKTQVVPNAQRGVAIREYVVCVDQIERRAAVELRDETACPPVHEPTVGEHADLGRHEIPRMVHFQPGQALESWDLRKLPAVRPAQGREVGNRRDHLDRVAGVARKLRDSLLDEDAVSGAHGARVQGSEGENSHAFGVEDAKRRPQHSRTSTAQSWVAKLCVPRWCPLQRDRIPTGSNSCETNAPSSSTCPSKTGRSGPRNHAASGTEKPIFRRYNISRGRRPDRAFLKIYFPRPPRIRSPGGICAANSITS